jgi:hypothetical protein
METLVFLLSESLAMADLNPQFINDVSDIFVVKTGVSISHTRHCPDYTILRGQERKLLYKN